MAAAFTSSKVVANIIPTPFSGSHVRFFDGHGDIDFVGERHRGPWTLFNEDLRKLID